MLRLHLHRCVNTTFTQICGNYIHTDMLNLHLRRYVESTFTQMCGNYIYTDVLKLHLHRYLESTYTQMYNMYTSVMCNKCDVSHTHMKQSYVVMYTPICTLQEPINVRTCIFTSVYIHIYICIHTYLHLYTTYLHLYTLGVYRCKYVPRVYTCKYVCIFSEPMTRVHTHLRCVICVMCLTHIYEQSYVVIGFWSIHMYFGRGLWKYTYVPLFMGGLFSIARIVQGQIYIRCHWLLEYTYVQSMVVQYDRIACFRGNSILFPSSGGSKFFKHHMIANTCCST